jgi:hypothetical protein
VRAGRTIWIVEVEDISFSLNVFWCCGGEPGVKMQGEKNGAGRGPARSGCEPVGLDEDAGCRQTAGPSTASLAMRLRETPLRMTVFLIE